MPGRVKGLPDPAAAREAVPPCRQDPCLQQPSQLFRWVRSDHSLCGRSLAGVPLVCQPIQNSRKLHESLRNKPQGKSHRRADIGALNATQKNNSGRLLIRGSWVRGPPRELLKHNVMRKGRPLRAALLFGAIGLRIACHSATLKPASPLDREVPHHPLLVMLEDVAVVHPLPGPVVRNPRDPHATFGRHVDRVLP